MNLVRIPEGSLLGKIGAGLYRVCCCIVRYRCEVVGFDECNRPYEACLPDPNGPYTTITCNDECQRPLPPYTCDDLGCDPCEECEKCECATAPVSECEVCVDGNIVPLCGECEHCVAGTCVPAPCICVEGDCICYDDFDCPSGYVCIGGVCVEQPYYCCIVTDTDVSPPVVTTICKTTPCDPEEGEEASGGPYKNSQKCDDACRKHDCKFDCCKERCQADESGEHLTQHECRQECESDPDDDACALGPTNPFTASGVGAGTHVYDFTIDSAPNRKICLQYVSTNCRPIRVQILADQIGQDGCTVTGRDVIKRDSQWRCDEECLCGDLPANQSCKGQPRGFLRWNTKQRCITSFKVRVFTLCADNNWEFSVACDTCEDVSQTDCENCCPPTCAHCDPCQTVKPIGLCASCDEYQENQANGCTEDEGELLSYPGKDCLDTYGRVVPAVYDYFAGFEVDRGAYLFAPCNSPFIGLCNKESPVAPVYPDCVSTPPCEPTGIDGDCCDAAHGCAGQAGDQCDCGWANYELALKYEECGNPPMLWVDLATHAEVTVDAACYCSVATFTEYRIYRAFVYNCETNAWDDKTQDLLYKTEWKQYQLGSESFDYPVIVAGPPFQCQSCETVSPDPTPDGDLPPAIVYVQPKVSAITCAPNPFP